MTAMAFDPANDDLVISTRKEIVFIEDNVADIATLVKGIGSGKEVVILDSTRDGLHQIAETLAGRTGIDALHVIAHGREGAADFGALQLNGVNAGAHSADLQAIGGSMAPNGDILLYGCNIGAGIDGAGFLERLAILTGADVAASNDLTGSAALGGDWALEVASGSIESQAVVDAQTAALYQQVLNIASANINFNNEANFVVTSSDTMAASTDTIYKVNGNPAYQLVIDGRDTGTSAYAGTGFFTPFVSAAPNNGDGSITIKFLAGQVFTATSISIANFYPVDQNLVIKGYDAAGNPVGGTATPHLVYGDNSFNPVPIALTGMTGIASLKITATSNGNLVRYLTIDDLSLTNIQPAAPKVSYLTSSNVNGGYKIGDQIDVQVVFDSAVDVTGTPQLKLETGTTDRVINYLSGSGTSTLTFRYTVQAGDTSADLDLFNTPIALNGGTIKSHTNAANADLTLPTPGGIGSLGVNKNIVVDGIVPTMTISSNKSVLKIGDTATITFTFSEDPGASFSWNGSSGDIAVSGGTLSAISGSGLTRIATFTPTAGVNSGTASISVAAGAFADSAGNINTSASNGPAITYDTLAPTVAITSSAASLKAGETATITFTFAEDPGASFGAGAISVSGGTLSAISGSGTTRTATFTPNANTDASSASIKVLAGAYQDPAGNGVTASNNLALAYDTKAPNAPSKPVLAAGDDTGASNSDGVTSDTSLSLSGSAEAGATVKLYDGATEIASMTATGGAYGFALSGVADGSHNFTAVAIDAAGNVGAASAGLAVTVDRTPPSTTIASAALSQDSGDSDSDMITRFASQTISGVLSANLAAGERVMVSVDNGSTWNPATASVGANTWVLTTVLSGSNTLKVKVEDLAGNGGTVYSHAYTIDQSAPATPSIPDLDAGSDSGASNTDNITGVTQPGFSGTADIGSTVRLFDGGIEIGSALVVDGTWHITTGNGYTMGERLHYITAEASDVAGNRASSGALVVDVRTTAPSTTATGMALSVDTGAPGDFITSQTIQNVSGTLSANLASGERVQLSLDGGATWSNTTSAVGSNTWSTFVALANGTHDIKVRVIDAVDNAGPVYTQPYTVDSVNPAVSVGSSASTLKAGETALITFTFSEDPGTSFGLGDITVSGGTLSALSGSGATRSATFTPTAGVNGGTASIAVNANSYQDIAGNDGAASIPRSIAFDTLAPGASTAPDLAPNSDKGASDTDNLTSQASLVFTGTAEAGATVKLYDSDGTTEIGSGTASGGNWTITTPALGQGSHTVTARVTDAAGNVSAASGATVVTIDTTRPTLAISSDASQLKSGGTATITFTFSEDPGTSFGSTDIAVSGGTLSAIQGTGLVRTAVFTPTANTNGGTASIGVGAGTYQDAAGNDGDAGATLALQFDTLAPATPSAPALYLDNGSSGTDNIVTDATPAFTGTAEAGTTITLYDADSGVLLANIPTSGGAWMAPSLTAMSEGPHRLYVTATDAAGNVSAPSAITTVTIDTIAPPRVTVGSDKGTVKIGETAIITFTFSADPGSDFSLANVSTGGAGTLGSLSGSGLTRTALFTPAADYDGGPIRIQIVNYRDTAGNTGLHDDLTIVVDTRAPAAPPAPALFGSDTGASSTDLITNDSTPTFKGGKEPGATVTLYDTDGTVLGTTASGGDGYIITIPALGEGVHTITARQTDAAGNVSQLSAGLTITIDTTAPDAPAAPKLAASSDTGIVGDGATVNDHPVVEGTALANTLVTLYEGSGAGRIKLGTAMSDGAGKWSIATTGLPVGTHALSATQTDLAGNESLGSSAFSLRVDAPSLIDGMPVTIQPVSLPGGVNGSAVSIPVVSAGRQESSGLPGVADIPLATSSQGGNLLLAQVAPGFGLSASGANVTVANAAELLLAAIKDATPTHAPADQGHLTGNGQSFLAGLASGSSLLVETVKPVSAAAPDGMLTLSGQAPGSGQGTALVIDATGLAAGSTIALQQVNFAAVIGAANVVAGSGAMLTGDAASQHFTVAAGGASSVFAGGGNDILAVGAPGGQSASPAAGLTVLHGGSASDTAAFGGARADYNLELHNGYVLVSSKAAPEAKSMLVNVEQLQFSDGSVSVVNSPDMDIVAGMYQSVLGRQADVMGIEYWANVHQAGASWGAILLSFITSPENLTHHENFNGQAAHDVTLLYAALFNREPDAGGLAYWVDRLNHGATLEQVATSFVVAAEMVGHQRPALDWDFIVV